MRVTADLLFPRWRLVPGTTKAKTTLKYSSDSTLLSEFTVTVTHVSVRSAEPLEKVKDMEKLGIVITTTTCSCVQYHTE